MAWQAQVNVEWKYVFFNGNTVFKIVNWILIFAQDDTLGLTSKSEYELALRAMGGVLWSLVAFIIPIIFQN